MDLQLAGRVRAAAARPNLGLALARSASEIEEAQRLRYQVFAEEMGAHLPDAGLSAARRIDRDAFDAYCEHLFGCASIPMVDRGREAALVWRHVQSRHLGPEAHRVFPLCRLPVEDLEAGANRLDAAQPVRLPPLIKGYFNAGALACGEPAWDPDFNTADLPVILSIHRMPQSYRRHFGLNMISQ